MNENLNHQQLNKQQYNIGEHVTVCGWAGSSTGTVKDLQWIYHNRLSQYCWGYCMQWDEGQSNPFSMTYIPEGYLRKDK